MNTMIEVTLENKSDFLKVKETLTRIGISSKKNNKLYQSCHILHKRSKYYIVHFKELFILDGKTNSFTRQDEARRNTIAILLEKWELLKIVDRSLIKSTLVVPVSSIKIIPFYEKYKWELIPKYTFSKGKLEQ